MNKIPINICLFSSTKGHWGRANIYLKTIKDLNRQIPLRNFSGLFAHVKITPGQEIEFEAMKKNLESYDFKVLSSVASWSHGEESHQQQYLNDLIKIYTNPEVLGNEYVLHLEDDWCLYPLDGGDLLKWFNNGVKLLSNNPNILQVRFPRFYNEDQRILGLKAKHGIDGKVDWNRDSTHFLTNDFSLNPSIFRGRDLRAAIILMGLTKQFEIHVEHGFGRALKLFGLHETPLAVLNPQGIKAIHTGAPVGEEDTEEPLFSN